MNEKKKRSFNSTTRAYKGDNDIYAIILRLNNPFNVSICNNKKKENSFSRFRLFDIATSKRVDLKLNV